MHTQGPSGRPGRILLAALLTCAPIPAVSASVADGRIGAARRSLAIPFAANHGQWDRRVAFAAASTSETVFVTRDGRIVHSLRPHTTPPGGAPDCGAAGWSLTESFVGGHARLHAGRPTPTRISRFLGEDPSRWSRDESTFASVELGNVWPGVRVSLDTTAGAVERVFRIAPGASAREISVRLAGATALTVNADASLSARTGLGDVMLTPPVAYQEGERGRRIPVPVSYRTRGSRYGFRLGPHDPSREVVIDPLVRTTYLGGSENDSPNSIAADPTSGDVYVAGGTTSTDFPGTLGGAQATNGAMSDAFVARLSGDLKTLRQATYLGGSMNEYARRVIFHTGTNEVVVMGPTQSANFPGTSGGAQASNAGSAYWVARLTTDLKTLHQSTYFGGNGLSAGLGSGALAFDGATNDILITGDTTSTNLPGTASGAQTSSGGDFDSFVARFDSSLTSLEAATYFGGSGREAAFGLAVESSTQDVLIAGYTQSTNLPGTSGGAQASSAGGQDAFAVRFNKGLTSIVQATYLGGTGADIAAAIVLQPGGSLFVTGGTTSGDFPHTAGGAQSSLRGGSDAFVAALAADLKSVVTATYLGGGFDENGQAIALQSPGYFASEVVVLGNTNSYDFPGVAGGIQAAGHIDDLFASRLTHDLSAVIVSTYLGGRSQDYAADLLYHPTSGQILVAGRTYSASLPGTGLAAQPTPGGVSFPFVADAFVALLDPGLTAAPIGSWVPIMLVADPDASASSDGNQVFEPGETVDIATFWKNATAFGFALTGSASSFGGPAGPTYSAPDVAAAYASTGAGVIVNCASTANCYRFGVSSSPRPAAHWDATFTETLSGGDVENWKLHIGNSFADVPRSQTFYRKIETLFHAGVTTGCSPTQFCPGQAVARDQMAIFVAKVLAGGGANVPVVGQVNGHDYRCGGGLSGISLYTDVSPSDPACKHIHYLAAQNITLGCSPTQFCPTDPVNRDSMAAFIAKAYWAPNGGPYVPTSYGPDPVTGLSYSCDVHAPNTHFSDVPVTDSFCKFVHYLWARGFVGGCSATAYCPTGSVTRDAMAKFIVNAFDLKLYGP